MTKVFRGLYTAIVTPFTDDGEVDFEAYEALVDRQLAAGVAGIVPMGTTGESPTIHADEGEKLVKITVDKCKGKAQVIVGVGTNSTAKTIDNSKRAEKLGADGLLVVNPYYNKPTQEGLYLHFKAVADAVHIPVVVYNIKGRTAVNVETPTLMRLIKDCENIVSVKEASGDLNQMKDVIAQSPDDFCALVGDDAMVNEFCKAGGDGLISVTSNLLPEKMQEFMTACLEGDTKTSDALHEDMKEIFEKEFIETNPIPIKTALAEVGLVKENFRLPMCKMAEDTRAEWLGLLKEKGVLE